MPIQDKIPLWMHIWTWGGFICFFATRLIPKKFQTTKGGATFGMFVVILFMWPFILIGLLILWNQIKEENKE